MFSKKKTEDQFDKIINAEDPSQKILLLKKQIEYFKLQKPEFEYEYKDFLKIIEEYQTSTNFEHNLIWLQLIVEIIRLNPTFKKRYFKQAMKIVFSENDESDAYNKENEEKKEEIFKIKINTINILTNKCEEIFGCDNFFQNLNHLKSLLKLLIIDFLPHYYNKENNLLLLMILNLFSNINKNIASKKYLKSNYFSVIFNLLIEILCFQTLYYSFKILEIKARRTKKNTIAFSNYSYLENMMDLNLNNDEINNINDQSKINEYIEKATSNNLLDLINKSNILFNLYLNLKEKNNLNIIINYQILMKILIIHCIESKYNEKNCIEFFNLIINNFKVNKILKMITDSFDDEIFNLFYIKQDEDNNGKLVNFQNYYGNNKLKSINIFFYLCEYRTKEIENNNYYNNFIIKFNKLRNKLIENKEYINNGLFILINLLLNDLLSKNDKKIINFEEEIIIITLIKCVMKYIIKTSVADMLDNNKTNIDNFVNLLIDSFGRELSEKIWKELMVLIKYYYFELSKFNMRTGIDQIKIILKKMFRLKINGNYKFDDNLFYDILNKVCDSKNKNSQINDYVLYSAYIKNKFKSSMYFNKNLFSCSEYFISLIKKKYSSFEVKDSKAVNDLTKTKEYKTKFSSDEILDILANYLLVYLNTYSKYENKNIEKFLYKNFIPLNFYFSDKINLQSQYIRLVIKTLNNTNDLNYFQCVISYMISLHTNQSNLNNSENQEQSVNLYKKLIIKLTKRLSETSQVKKLDYLFESIFNRLEACLNDDIDYNFLNNILEIFRCTSITKYNEILFNNNPQNNNKTDNINDNYFNIGQNFYTAILVNDEKVSKKVSEQWSIFNIKKFFIMLIKMLKKDNIIIEYKEKIINFIKEKISDIFFFNKINIDLFIDYIIELDKINLKNFILLVEKSNIILSINEILKNISYLILYHNHLFEIKDYKQIYDKLINYTLDKINYFKKIIRLIIKKYDIRILKNKNWKNINFWKNLLGTDPEGMPNFEHLKLDQSDFKFKKDKEKDINYNLFVNEDIQINTFVYPKKNFGELIKYLKSYFEILSILLNSLYYKCAINTYIENSSFTKQIEEKKMNIRFDKGISMHINNQDTINSLSDYNKKKIQISNEALKKFSEISEKVFNIFNQFPLIIKYNNSFLIEIFKLFFYLKGFLISSGEKYIIKSILVLFNISFPEDYDRIFDNLNNEFKTKYNEGKDFLLYKIISIKMANKSSNLPEDKIENRKRRISSLIKNALSENIINKNNISNNNLQKSGALSNVNKPNISNLSNFHSKSMVSLKEQITVEGRFARRASIDETIKNNLENYNDDIINNDKKSENKNESEQSAKAIIILIKKLIIDYTIKSKNSLKIYNIINKILSGTNEEENKIFLLIFKWKIINKETMIRNENINVFKNRRKIKNYYGGSVYNISIENEISNKTISIKSPISNTNYLINNNYRKIPYKNMNKIIMKSMIPENEYKRVENILNKKHSQENKKINSIKEKYIKNDTNTFCFASTPNLALNEIKELDEDKDNFTDSDNDNENIKNEDNDNEINDDIYNNEGDDKSINKGNINIPNLEELISVMHNKTKNDTYKYYSNNINALDNISHQINDIDRSSLYNEMNINVMYIINYNEKKKIDNVHNTNFIKFLKILTMQDDDNFSNKSNRQKEYIYSDNFNIAKFVINKSNINNNPSFQTCLIFNNTLENNYLKSDSLLMNMDTPNNLEKIYLFIFIIPLSEEFWKIEFKINPKKKEDYYLNSLKEILEMNFLNCYILSVKNEFSYIVYQLKILLSLLQNLMCIIKREITDKKLLNKLQGIKNEEMMKRMYIFSSINL